MSAALDVRTALIALLQADSAVAQLVSTRVYDEVPRDDRGNPSTDLTSPWIYVGPIQQTRFEEGYAEAWTVRVRIYAASLAFGRTGAWELGDAIKTAVELKPLSLTDWTVPLMRIVNMGDIPPPANPKQVFLDIDMQVISKTAYPY